MNGELDFQLVKDESAGASFDCSNETINKYVRDGYYNTLLQCAYMYSISAGGRILGFYQIMFREIEAEDLSSDETFHDGGLKDGVISAVHIRFLAVDKRFHKNKIGTNTLRVIIKRVLEFAQFWPIRVITIDALNDLVEWYKEMGFVVAMKNTPSQNGVSTLMYYVCDVFAEELEKYEAEYLADNC